MTRSPASGTIQYELYTDASYQPSSIWGTVGGTAPPAIDVTIGAGGSGNVSHAIYGLISGGQTTVPTDNVHSVYTQSPAVEVAWADATGNPSCTAIGGSNLTGGSASVTATYQPTCTLSADPLAFGNLATTQNGADTSTALHATCSAATPFTVWMNGGLTGATDPALRQMQNGANRLTYGIYRDASRTQVWGDTASVNELGGSGSGGNLTIPVYGRVQPQTTPPVGTYTDTVVVTINY
jgi:spore coat protein U-like protein